MPSEIRLVLFPDGTTVAAAPLSARRKNAPLRDYGLYCDPAWAPTWEADLIDWPDFGLPADPKEAARLIAAAFERAQRGEHVEVGCIGGLGRTGTVLACMAILAGVPPVGAVDWIRTHYDEQAVETAEQEAWVLGFAEIES